MDDIKIEHNLISVRHATRLPDKLPSIANVVVVEVSGDIERAKEAIKRAEESVNSKGADIDIQKALSVLRTSKARLRVANRRRSVRRPSGN